MKIKLIINNQLEDELCSAQYDPNTKKSVEIRRIKPYDERKWKDQSVYEFNTLKEMKEFIDSCDIDFTDEYAARFCCWDWEEIDIDYYIDPSEDNLIILRIGSHSEWRD